MPPLIGLSAVRRLAVEWGVPPLQVERTALENGVVPVRYQLNLGTIGIAGQLELLLSTVGVCGLGGLGGGVVESLARFGVGRLILVDGDVFDAGALGRRMGGTVHLSQALASGLDPAAEHALRIEPVAPVAETAEELRFGSLCVAGPTEVWLKLAPADVP